MTGGESQENTRREESSRGRVGRQPQEGSQDAPWVWSWRKEAAVESVWVPGLPSWEADSTELSAGKGFPGKASGVQPCVQHDEDRDSCNPCVALNKRMTSQCR